MIISISGTPCTGKTAVAKILAKKVGANLLSINKLLHELNFTWDPERKTKVVDIKVLQRIINKKLTRKKINIIEGHLAHLLGAGIIVILRCNPVELQKRMRKKGWGKEKVAENMQAEILDEITIEAVEKHGKRNVFEVDTSNKKPAATAAIINKLLNSLGTKKYRPGRIDWSEKYKNYLMIA